MKQILMVIVVVIGIILGFAYLIYLNMNGYVVDLHGWNKANYKNKAIDNIESQLNSYKALSELDNNSSEVIELSHLYGKFFAAYYKPNTGNVFAGFVPKSESLSRRIVVFTPQGKKIALVESDSRIDQVEDFILTQKGSYHFNSHLPPQFVEYEEVSSSIAREQDLLDIYEKSEFFIHQTYDNPYDATQTYIFFKDNLWKKATINKALAPSQYLDRKTASLHHLNKVNNYKLPIVIDEEKNYKLHLDYFEKQMYSKKRTPVYGSPTGAGKRGYWQGTGYFSLFMGDKIFKIKVPKTKLYSEKLASSITIYGHKDLDYVIWQSSTLNSGYDDSGTYMIK